MGTVRDNVSLGLWLLRIAAHRDLFTQTTVLTHQQERAKRQVGSAAKSERCSR